MFWIGMEANQPCSHMFHGHIFSGDKYSLEPDDLLGKWSGDRCSLGRMFMGWMHDTSTTGSCLKRLTRPFFFIKSFMCNYIRKVRFRIGTDYLLICNVIFVSSSPHHHITSDLQSHDHQEWESIQYNQQGSRSVVMKDATGNSWCSSTGYHLSENES